MTNTNVSPPAVITSSAQLQLSVVIQIVLAIIAFAGFIFSALHARVGAIENTMVTRGQVELLNARFDTLSISMRKIETQLEKPRFTKEDFQSEIRPLSDQMLRNSAALAKWSDWMDGTDNRIRDLERHTEKRNDP